ncbi:cytochrome c1 [Sphingomonas sp.]|jgi:ubiquinol-cytochrome c reductase cytochrome c1 subunit|uniref:cytochrome c1 n=1 Tax=Sphingomonas sp. TaxID=28214 RepID=UPI002D7E7E3A|nr:cytochrome c1 [Sphingomonas sp.]HEU0044129.1 cytochrome c1 [Sphingomonas sp.]
MARLISIVIGAGFVFVLALALFFTAKEAIQNPTPETAEHEFHVDPRDADLPSNSIFGKFDKAQLQRGLKVYQEVCAACHSLKYVSFRNLTQLGYSEGQVKALAAAWPVEQPSSNPETGEAMTRKNVPSDRFPSPYLNEIAGRAANNNALPPDLSLMVKAREDGANYIYSLLNGYKEQEGYKNEHGEELLKKFPGARTPEGLYFNPTFPNLNIAMPPPISSDGQVTYDDGTKATRDQMAKDVAAFLVWTAEPNLESRHAAGLGALGFIIIFIFLTIGAYRNVWRNVKH